MKILLIASSYLPVKGGLQTVTSQLAAGLQQRGHEVRVITQRYPRSLAAREVVEGLPVERWFFMIPRWTDLARGRFDLVLAGIVFLPLTLARLVWLLLSFQPDVVNLHFVGAPAPFVWMALHLVRFRLVVSLHGDDVEGLPRGTWFDHWMFRAALRRADVVTACSRYLLERALSIEPSISSKAHVIYNGIAVEECVSVQAAKETDSHTKIILGAGRLMPSKGWDVLLRAWSLCKNPNWRLVIIGGGPEYQSLCTLASALGLDSQVEIEGSQERASVLGAIANSHFVVIPSRRETFGMVALEAMACGKPVVASCVGGLPEVLQGADAMLVEPDDPVALAQALGKAWQQLERDPSFGMRNRAIAEKFSSGEMVGRYEILLANQEAN